MRGRNPSADSGAGPYSGDAEGGSMPPSAPSPWNGRKAIKSILVCFEIRRARSVLFVRQNHTIRHRLRHDLIPLAGVAFTIQPRRAMGRSRLPVRRRKSLPVALRLPINLLFG